MSKLIFAAALCSLAGITIGRVVLERTQELLESLPVNDGPIIGVLSQEQSYYLGGKFPGLYDSYIAASYVKFVEGGGSRVVPIW